MTTALSLLDRDEWRPDDARWADADRWLDERKDFAITRAEDDAAITSADARNERRLDATARARSMWRCGCGGFHRLGVPAGCCGAVDAMTLAAQLAQPSLPLPRHAFAATAADSKDATGPANTMSGRAAERETDAPRGSERQSGGAHGAHPAGQSCPSHLGLPAGPSSVNPEAPVSFVRGLAVLPDGLDCLCGTSAGPCALHSLRGAHVTTHARPVGPQKPSGFPAEQSPAGDEGRKPIGRVGGRR